MMNSKLLAVLLIAFIPVGCNNHKSAASGAVQAANTANNDDSIRMAIQAHLAHKGTLDVKAFDTQVKQVTYDGNHAKALVEFRVKNGPGVMQLTYDLAKTNNAWAVVESKPMGSDFSHPPLDKSGNPAASGAMRSSGGGANTLDNRFRGDIGAPPPGLPPGHPAVNPTPQNAPPN